MRRVLMLVAVSSAACGGTTEGSACSTPDAVTCAGATTVLVCEASKWKGYPCPSCGGGKCDWKGAVNGNPCPKVAESYGTCPLDGRLVGCYYSTIVGSGLFVESACSACVAGKSLEELGKCSAGGCTCN